MRTLCPHCGTITNHRWSPLPPPCPSCKKRLPLRLPRQLSYLTRSFWKPVLILSLLAVLLGFSSQFQLYRQNLRNKLFLPTVTETHIPPSTQTQ
jgi:hypothetical protein